MAKNKFPDLLEAGDAEVLEYIVSRASHKRIAVIGDSMLDVYFSGKVGKRSPEGDFDVVELASQSECFGGAAHVANQLKAFGCNVKLLSVVGYDEAGHVIKEDFPDVVMDPYVTTTVKIRMVADGKQVARADRNMASQYRFHPGDILTLTPGLRETLATANVIVISDYDKGVVCDSLLDLIHGVCARRGIPLIVDPKRPPFKRYFPAVTLTPNVYEMAAELSRGYSFGAFFEQPFFDEAMAKYYADNTVDNMIVTRGNMGIRISSRNAEYAADFPALRTDNPNVCGAGDIVAAYLAVAEAANVTVWQAAHLANLAAGLAVRKEGTPIVSPKEIFSHLGTIDA